MKLTTLMETLHIYQLTNSMEDITINKLEMDSRNIERGDLFICIPGYTVDGHDFAHMAEEKGAAAIIAERPLPVSIPVIVVNDSQRAMAKLANHFYHYPTQHMHLVGVTGTNGKTTTSYLLETIFQQDKKKTGLIGTIQMKINNEAFEVNNTTPDSLFLQKHFAQMVDSQVENAVMEVSSHALDLGRVHGCDYDVAVFTNISQDHLDFHKDMDDYVRAKSLLFSQLGNTYKQTPKYAVVNRDDAYYQTFIKSTAQEVITYGIEHECDIRAEQLQLGAKGTTFTLSTPVGSVEINSPLIGKFSVYNILAAASAAIVSNVSLDTIKKAMEQTSGVSGRFEPVLAGQDFGVIVDYAHTPDSLENVLQTIKQFANNKIHVVVGCGGDRDTTKRPLMAKVAVQYADNVILTSDNPRSEDPVSILQDMEAGIEGQAYQVVVNRRDAIELAITQASEDDVVLIAGKGHETYQEVHGERSHFDDREVARECIASKM
ncbi:UDP-N-acetylmuramoyl-L-alanyl-D-glutamate--2,6-diaminopimelate ligase [Pontibacillus salicampi]|uniref:UDP-N-acetylmuramoyl-L-alanyl-D-glutamate--2,6-diaminopimelate ligase n=1 Tax=Pontibacillus salicampi TaxID=1449801 RepID=A0ABV6LNS6_9BACI